MITAHWQFDPSQVIPVLLLAVAYQMRVRTLAARGRPVPLARVVSFDSGLLVLLLALVSPIDWYGENRLLWVHMTQHLLLGDIAPVLILAGLTGPVLRPLIAIGWVRRMRSLAHPLVALPLWIVDLYAWHFPFLYQAALRHDGIHALEHLCFLSFGALMWAALIEPLPGPAWFSNGWKAIYILVVRGAGMLLANVFLWENHPLYPYYVAVQRGRGISTMSDQRAAGVVMLIEGSIVTVLAFGWMFIRLIRELEVRQRLIELEVDESRAARAARYGRSAQARDLSP
ncbi:MAG: cytochrome c oxidase assembly protein [Solirubrobacteraceae bacterium]